MRILPEHTAGISLKVGSSTTNYRPDKFNILGEPLREQCVPRNVPLKQNYGSRLRIDERFFFLCV